MKAVGALALVLAFLSLSVMADQGLVPVPLTQDHPIRLEAQVTGITDFVHGLGGIGGGFAAAFALGSGFEAGVQGSVVLTGSGPKIPFYAPGTALVIPVGLLGMVRYFGHLTDMFHLGFQLQAAYIPAFATNAAIDWSRWAIDAGIPFDFKFGDAAWFYFMPEFVVHMGRNPDTKKFDANIGGDLRVGTLIALGTPTVSLMLEATPSIDFIDRAHILDSFYTAFTIGVVVDL